MHNIFGPSFHPKEEETANKKYATDAQEKPETRPLYVGSWRTKPNTQKQPKTSLWDKKTVPVLV